MHIHYTYIFFFFFFFFLKDDKNYPVLNGELELILARPVNNNKPHSHAKYYKRLRDTGDDVMNPSIIDISEADQNLVIVCWLLDRCEYKVIIVNIVSFSFLEDTKLNMI